MRFVTVPWLTSVWLPWVVILPFLATVFLCAAVISGRVYCLPAAVLAASFIVQTQLGYTLVLAVVMLLSLLSLVPRLRSWLALEPRLSGSLPKAMLIAAVVLAIVWTPPAIKQILGMPGRISETVRYFAQQGVGHSWQEAEKTLACAMAACPASLVGVDLKRAQITESFDGPSGHPAIVLLAVIPQLVLLPVCCLLARRRRRDFDSAPCLLAVFLVPLCLFSIRRISGEIVFHHVFWMTALGLLNVYVIGGTVGGFFCFWVGPASLGDAPDHHDRECQEQWPAVRLPTRDPQAGASDAPNPCPTLRLRWAAVGTLIVIAAISLCNVVQPPRDLPMIRGQAFDWYNHDPEDAKIEGGDEHDAARSWHLPAPGSEGRRRPLPAADHRTAPFGRRHGDDPGLDQTGVAARARSVVCAGLLAASGPRRGRPPTACSCCAIAMLASDSRRNPAWQLSRNRTTPYCFGCPTTPWGRNSGRETVDERSRNSRQVENLSYAARCDEACMPRTSCLCMGSARGIVTQATLLTTQATVVKIRKHPQRPADHRSAPHEDNTAQHGENGSTRHQVGAL